MKKLLLVLVAVMGLTFAANAQNIGVRLGGGQGFGAELSYQQGLGGMNRLEADLGYHSWAGGSWLSLSALYQAHFDINAVPNLGWYAGVGPRIDLYTGGGNANIGLGICGQAGLDYHFDALPVQLSLDIRPCFYLYPNTSFQWGDIALGIRYML
jgi:hypothetical protein